MNLDKFTIKAREAFAQVQQIAAERGNQELTPSHLMRALLMQKDGAVLPIIQALGVSPGSIYMERTAIKITCIYGRFKGFSRDLLLTHIQFRIQVFCGGQHRTSSRLAEKRVDKLDLIKDLEILDSLPYTNILYRDTELVRYTNNHTSFGRAVELCNGKGSNLSGLGKLSCLLKGILSG